MNVLYDHQIFSLQRYGGISRYFAEMLHVFRRTREIQFDLTTRFTENAYVREYHLADSTPLQRLETSLYARLESIPALAPVVLQRKQDINKAWKERMFREGRYDVFHPTYYEPSFVEDVGDKPVVVTVYDMVHEIFPGMYDSNDPTSSWKSQVIARADKLIAISDHTRKDLVRIAGVPEEKIAVVHLAGTLNPANNTNVSVPLPEKFILFVGERIRYKNFERFIRSIEKLLQSDRNLFVICASGWPMNDWEKQLLAELDLERQVLHHVVDDATLACLYNRAIMFVFPSLYEGFGMPVLEAFSCGCPVVLSNKASLPEVADDAALYIDPLDEESIRCGVERVLHDKELRERLVAAGRKRATCFSWEKTARETRGVYETLL